MARMGVHTWHTWWWHTRGDGEEEGGRRALHVELLVVDSKAAPSAEGVGWWLRYRWK